MSKIELGEMDVLQVSTAFVEGKKFVKCPFDPSVQVLLANIAPDVCLSHLSVLTDITGEEEIGSGSFGKVWKAVLNSKTPVAIKELMQSTSDNNEMVSNSFI